MIRTLFTLFLFAVCAACSFAQEVTWEDFAEIYFQDMDEESEEGVTLYDELLEMHRNPININLAQRADFLCLPFLSEAQSDSILSSIKRSYGYYSLGELYGVKNLTYKEIRFMPLFFYCDRPKVNDSSKNHKGAFYESDVRMLKTEISSTLGVPLYKREGFKTHTPEELEKNPNKQYLGDNLSTTFRYRSSYGNRLYWGLTAQKDEGEPFCYKDNALYDSYSFYLMGKSRGALRQWVVGDYRAQMGLGLTVGTSVPDAMSILTSFSPRQQGFTRHTSTDEAFFMRGGALSLKFGSITVNAFASWRGIDATLYKDSISTIITNGYHRTPLEMSKRRNVECLQGGLSANIEFGNLSVGLQAAHTHYDKPYRTPTSLYRKYYFRGQNFGNYSLYYAYKYKSSRFWGETATSLQGGVATQHRFQYAPSYRLKLVALHRYYSTHYLSATAQSYKIGSRVQNEHGLLLGAGLRVGDFWQLNTYVDYAHYPFAVYATRHQSDAVTAAMQWEYYYSENTTWLFRYKYRMRPQDNKLHELDSKQQHSFKAQVRYKVGSFSMTTAADLLLLSQPDKSNTMGYMLSHKAITNFTKSTRLNLAASLYHTDSYSEALRFYEPVMLYSSGFPLCYYHGQYASVSLQQKIGILEVAVKYALTHYSNRKSVGSGLRKYDGSTLQNVVLQGVVKF